MIHDLGFGYVEGREKYGFHFNTKIWFLQKEKGQEKSLLQKTN